MKKQKINKKIVKILLFIQLVSILFNFSQVKAKINGGEKLELIKNHKCDSVLEYLDKNTNEWRENIVWYVYYTDLEDGKKYPAFCVEQAKEEKIQNNMLHLNSEITKKGKDMRVWRVLNKGYMGSNYREWNLEYDDDFYIATKIAVQSLIELQNIKDKYRAMKTDINENIEDKIEERGKKVLEVANKLYYYGINGEDTYEEAKIEIKENSVAVQEKIDNKVYYIQNYKLESNRDLISYQVKLENFPKETKIIDEKNNEQKIFINSSFKIAVPISELQEDIIGKIKIENAKIKTNLLFHCLSYGKESQGYRICSNETATTQIEVNIKLKQTNLFINKIDKETKKPISNVTFEIKDDKGNKLQEITTNKEGIAKIENIKEQTVLIKEIKVPNDYILNEEEIKVYLKWGETTNITIKNERKKEEKIPEQPKLPRTGF